MSVRGPRGGQTRGCGRGRGRGRGGKIIVWEWETYRPGPEVYDQLWHVRKEPATVTPFLPTECPIPNAQTRILDRRQTEGDIQRNFYVVEVTQLQPRDPSISSDADEVTKGTESYHVDLSRILEFVSPDELERYENEQFRLEAEAEEVARRAEAEEVARRRLQKNARAPGTGKGSRMLSGLGLDAETRTRGRPRGRGRGRGRGSWLGRGALLMNNRPLDDDTREELVEAEPMEALLRAEEELQDIVAETESEDEPDTNGRMQTSPGIARSAFVANSALPVSPTASMRRASGNSAAQLGDTEEYVSDIDPVDEDTRSMSSAAMQLRIEDDFNGRSNNNRIGLDDELGSPGQYPRKRRRTQSIASAEHATRRRPIDKYQKGRAYSRTRFASLSKDTVSESESEPERLTPLRQLKRAPHSAQSSHQSELGLEDVYVRPRSPSPTPHQFSEEEENGSADGDGDDAEEYVVEGIIEHYREAGKTYYLVKWQGYEDSHDWLPEEDLEGATELVAEYNTIIRQRKKLHKTKK
ncbi:hypothetical protein BKA63DRAFT_57612 [Paraphoma chrysanthemicola]|nr:hypothetical protein BKA63DRAFT_57612 [Paraphoma chrysanthemicola]